MLLTSDPKILYTDNQQRDVKARKRTTERVEDHREILKSLAESHGVSCTPFYQCILLVVVRSDTYKTELYSMVMDVRKHAIWGSAYVSGCSIVCLPKSWDDMAPG